MAAPAHGAHATAVAHDDGHGHGAAPAHGAHAAAAAHDDGHGHAAAPDEGHAAGHGHHGGTPHESPWQITLVLATLATGSVLTLFLGLPEAWTHVAPALERWLEPVLVAEVRFAAEPRALEFVFQGLGVLAATIGFVAARAIYKDNRNEALLVARIERWKGLWTTVYNKYYVDEFYEWLVLRPAARFARAMSWIDGEVIDRLVNLAGTITRGFAGIDGAIDRYLVDGAVNAGGAATMGLGRSLRLLQTGRIQTYLYGALGGALVVVLVNFLIS